MILSIIVPVYNVENYIKDCIQSLLAQSLQDIEIIVVDDGSLDNSIEKVKEFNDERIKIVRKENGGLSSARNEGLKIAQGEYIAFVDSDDYICLENAYEEMCTIAKRNNSDIVMGDALWYYSDKKNHIMNKNKLNSFKSSMTGEEFFVKCLKNNIIYAPVWLNIYKRRLLFENKLLFKEGIYHEDEEFTPRVLIKAKNISVYKNTFYVYRQREGSITNSKINIKKGLDILDTCLELKKVILEIKNDELKYLFKKYIAEISIEQIYKYKILDISKETKKYIYSNSVTIRLKLKSILIKMNPKIYILLESKYRKMKRILC